MIQWHMALMLNTLQRCTRADSRWRLNKRDGGKEVKTGEGGELEGEEGSKV